MIREYTHTDLTTTARVWLRSGQAEYHYLSAFQELDEARAIDVFRRLIQDRCKIWVYEINEEVIGFIAMDETLIDRLYIDPRNQSNGIGSKLIKHAKDLSPEGLILKTHVQNTRARSFYEKRGFKPVAFGLSPPPESMPDVEYHWNSDELVDIDNNPRAQRCW